MTAAQAQRLLLAWEQGHGAHAIRRALAVLHAAWPEAGAAHWARMTIGERDGWLLDLHETLFGASLETVTQCPQCGERLELAFRADALRADGGVNAARTPIVWQGDGYVIDYRLPTSDDLLHVLDAAADDRAAVDSLLGRCILAIRHAGDAPTPPPLPDDVVTGLQEDMARHDAGAEMRMRLTCPACGHGWDAHFDIATYVWNEVDDWAQRTLSEIHMLATAYGWNERDILELGSLRRRHYLELVRA